MDRLTKKQRFDFVKKPVNNSMENSAEFDEGLNGKSCYWDAHFRAHLSETFA